MRDESSGVDAPRGPSTRRAGMVTGVVLFGVGLLILVDTWRLGAGWAPDGPQAGYFPFRIGLLIALCSVIVFIQAFRARNDPSLFVEWRKLVPVSQILFPLIAYIAAMQYLGMYVASALFVAALMRWLGKYTLLKSLTVAVIMSVVIFWLFEYQFSVPLPKGPLEQWLGY
jgi:putative tricarboxylic transport membrane protein